MHEEDKEEYFVLIVFLIVLRDPKKPAYLYMVNLSPYQVNRFHIFGYSPKKTKCSTLQLPG